MLVNIMFYICIAIVYLFYANIVNKVLIIMIIIMIMVLGPWGVLWSLYQAIRDLEIYKKQILEDNLESPSGHQGFSNFKKAGPRRLFCLESPSSPVSWVSIAWILVPCRF